MFRLSIVTPERVFFEGEINSLIVPGTEGYIGILAHHAPLISALKPGRVEFRDLEEKINMISVTKGFLEVSGNVATILCDAAEFAQEIDIARAQKSFDEAKERIVMAGRLDNNTEIDVEAEKEALERASNRIRIYKEQN